MPGQSARESMAEFVARRRREIAGREHAEEAGRDAWGRATREGRNLIAARPGDVIAIGARVLDQRRDSAVALRRRGSSVDRDALIEAPALLSVEDVSPIEPAQPADLDELIRPPGGIKFATAQNGDSISRLLGTSDPAAIGKFLSVNGLDGRNSTLRVGQSYVVPTEFNDATRDEIAAGGRLSSIDNARLAELHARRAEEQAAREGLATLINAGINPWTGQRAEARPPAGPSSMRRPSSWLDENAGAKALGGFAARGVGNVAGLGTGALHTAEGIGGGLVFVSRLMDPYDAMKSPRGSSAADQLISTARGGFDYAKNGVAAPQSVVRDVRDKLHQMNVDLNPAATPAAATFYGELQRNFGIGRNQGEFVFDVGTLVVGGPATKALSRFGAAPKATGVAEYLARGYGPGLAEYFATPYAGRGHHFVPRAWEFPEKFAAVPLPKVIAGQRLPRGVSDSSFNVLKPRGITTGDFYELHYRVDPSYHGGEIPRRHGGGSWRGEDLGWEKYGPLDRVRYGSPAPLKGAVAAAGTGAGALVYGALDEESRP